MNSINIIGNLAKDVELRYGTSGSAISNFSIAVDQSYKDKSTGQKVEKVSFFDVVSFGRNSEIINQHFSKGKKIGISGSLDQQTWKDGQTGQNRSKVVIKLESFTFVEKKEGSAGYNNSNNNDSYNNNQGGGYSNQQQNSYQKPPNTPPSAPIEPIEEESIPF